MRTFYWYKQCPRCKQGELTIMEDLTHRRLYFHCGECETGFLRPEDTDDSEKGFLTLTEDFEAENPSLERIVALGWGEFAKHRFDI